MLKHILHPTDFSPESETAFRHALKLAVSARAELNIVHFEPDPKPTDLERFPSVRKTLIEWGVLPARASQQDVAELGITVRKMSLYGDEPGLGILHFLSQHDEDLIVLSTHQRHGIDRWFHPEIATKVAMRSHIATLFIPPDTDGFVNPVDGSSSLRRIVLPVADLPSPQTALDLTATMLRKLGGAGESPIYSVVHVGPEPMLRHDIHYPRDAEWQWEWLARGEEIVHDIVEVAKQKSADLIAMTTQGHTCWKDILSGSTTENVVHEAPCPVLAVYVIGSAPLRTARPHRVSLHQQDRARAED